MVTTLEILFDRKKTFDCKSCLSQYPKHPQREKLIAQNQKAKNCQSEGNSKFKTSYGTVTIGYKKCPGNYFGKWAEHLFSLQESNRDDLHSPAKNRELFDLMDSIKRNLEQKEMEKYAKHSRSRR